jgi:hypothetical protein
MNLNQQKQRILDILLNLIKEGSALNDRLNSEYDFKVENNTFMPENDIPIWYQQYNNWYGNCISGLIESFSPAIIIINKFKNPLIDASYPIGKNIEVSTLIKNLVARLELVGVAYESVAVISEPLLSDFLEISIGVPGLAGAKIKVDKIISYFARK